MTRLRMNNPGLRFFLQYWQKYCTLEGWHIAWARQHIYVLPYLERGQSLYYEGDKQKYIYLVADGMLARIGHNRRGTRLIYSVATPGLAMMTTAHPHSRTPSKGDIIALRSKTLVIQIPYRAIIDFKPQDPHISTLNHILLAKKKKQISTLSRIMHEQEPLARYFLFADEMPELHRNLSHVEVAEILGISLSSAKRYHKLWLIQ